MSRKFCSSASLIFIVLFFQSREFEDELEMSLNLTEEIDELTQKMIGTMKGELSRSRRKDFGSSYW
jgi:hypothetical protein